MLITLLWYCCTCNALRAATQVCHTTCSSSSFLTAATVSFTPLRSLLPSFRFITPRSQLNHLLQGRASHCQTQTNTHENATAFPQANPTILTGFHSASLRHSFTSVAFSPPAALYFARRLSPFRLRSLSAAPNTSPDTWLIRPSFRHAALSSLASFRRLRTLTGNILRRLHMELASASFVGLY